MSTVSLCQHEYKDSLNTVFTIDTLRASWSWLRGMWVWVRPLVLQQLSALVSGETIIPL